MMINPKLFICDNFEIKNVVDATLSVMCSELNMAQQFEFNKWNIEFKEGILEELCEDEIYFWSLADFYDAFVSKLADHFGIEKDFSFLRMSMNEADRRYLYDCCDAYLQQ